MRDEGELIRAAADGDVESVNELVRRKREQERGDDERYTMHSFSPVVGGVTGVMGWRPRAGAQTSRPD